jgi:molybdopterin converting factor small subunit
VKIAVRYLSILEDLSGTAREQLEVPDGIDVAQLLRIIARANSARLEQPMVSALVGGRHACMGTVLADGDEVVLMPRLSGG